MRRDLQHVAGRQHMWVVITGSYKSFKTTSAWPEHKHHTCPLPVHPSCVGVVSLAPALHLIVAKMCKSCLTFQESWTNAGSLQKEISAKH